MKYFTLVLVFIISTNIFAQKKSENINIFIRIYDLQGEKINKGKIKFISESTIELYLKGETVEVPLNKIGKIKTKHSGGNNIVKGALIGRGSLAIVGLLSGNDKDGFISFSATDKAALGLVGGGFFGAIYGAITIIFKKAEVYIIDGDKIKFKNFKDKIKS